MFIPSQDTGAQFRDVNLICGKYGDITDLRAMIVKSLEEYEVTLASLFVRKKQVLGGENSDMT